MGTLVTDSVLVNAVGTGCVAFGFGAKENDVKPKSFFVASPLLSCVKEVNGLSTPATGLRAEVSPEEKEEGNGLVNPLADWSLLASFCFVLGSLNISKGFDVDSFESFAFTVSPNPEVDGVFPLR